MRAQVNLTRIGLYLRYGALVVLGGVSGLLLSRLLSPRVLERGGPFVFVVFAVFLVAVVLIARLLRRVWP
jgi:hypothetical protein